MKYNKIIKCDLVTYYPDSISVCRKIPNVFVLVGDAPPVCLNNETIANDDWHIFNSETVAYVTSIADVVNFCKENNIYISYECIDNEGLLTYKYSASPVYNHVIGFNLDYIGNENNPICYHPENGSSYALCSGNDCDTCEKCAFFNEFAPNPEKAVNAA